MAYWDTYSQIGQAEDVHDDCYDISPVDNPTVMAAKKIEATAVLHQWHEDELAEPASNKKTEGADAGADTSTALINRTNWCQIMEKVAEISGTLEAVRKYGRDSEMAYQLEKRYKELARDEEFAVVGKPGGTRQTGDAGDGSNPREMKSLVSQLHADHVIDALDANQDDTANDPITTIEQLEEMILDGQQAAYEAGGNARMLLVNPGQTRYISKFVNSAGRQRDFGNDRMLVNVIDLYVGPNGEMDVVNSRNTDDCIKGIDPDYIACAILRPTTDEPLGKIGDSRRRQVIREGTFAVLNSKAHFAVDNVPTTLTLAP